MASGSLARRYAKAVMALPNAQPVATELRALAKAMTDSPSEARRAPEGGAGGEGQGRARAERANELVTVLTNPAIRRSDRRKVIDGLLQRINAQPNTKNLVYLLLDGERMSSLAAISRELDAMIEAKGGRVSATITSAKPLDPSQISQITAALETLSGKKVDVTRKEDPALLGGVVAKVGDVVYDGSLRTQLRTLREELTK